jgi:hypothetical protein
VKDSKGVVFLIMGMMMLPVGIVFLLLYEPKFTGGVFLLLAISNLLTYVLVNSRKDEQQ